MTIFANDSPRDEGNPFFSIIVATLNAEEVLSRLLLSLVQQTYRNFEVILQDGGSCDGTLEIVRSFQKQLPAISIISERDSGIYDAWNKALTRVRGEWVLFLGSDDSLAESSTLEKAHTVLSAAAASVLFGCGSLECVSPKGEIYIITPRVAEFKEVLQQGCMPTGHPAAFHRVSVFIGQCFDPTLRIAGDYDFFCRTWVAFDDALSLDFLVTSMGGGGISDGLAGAFQTRKEVLQILRRHYQKHVSFSRHVLPVWKGVFLTIFCEWLGEKRAALVLDRLRVWRGLPPVWVNKGRS